eukprot:scaffold70307_cov44-Prasinocladus_malaysianus.AAC.2
MSTYPVRLKGHDCLPIINHVTVGYDVWPPDRLAAYVAPGAILRAGQPVPLAVRTWVDDIVRDWKFKQIIPCHFAAPIPATPKDFRQAFDWLEAESQEFGSAGAKTEANVADEEEERQSKGSLGWLSALRPPGAVAGKKNNFFKYNEADMKLLNGINETLLKFGVFK